MAKAGDIVMPYRGKRANIWYARARNGRLHARDFLERLQKGTKAKFYYIITALADHGRVVNEQMFRQVSDNIWEMKVHSPGLRLLCFALRGDWYLTHGCPKLKQKEFQKEIMRAERIRQEHLAWSEEPGVSG